MLNESQQKPKPRRQRSTHKKKTGWKQTMSKSKSKKRRKIRKKQRKSTLARQERQHAREIRILQARKERGGGVAPRRNNRITESTTKESREAKVKAKKAMQESNGKRRDERTKTNEKETRNGTRRTTKRWGKKRLRVVWPLISSKLGINSNARQRRQLQVYMATFQRKTSTTWGWPIAGLLACDFYLVLVLPVFGPIRTRSTCFWLKPICFCTVPGR